MDTAATRVKTHDFFFKEALELKDSLRNSKVDVPITVNHVKCKDIVNCETPQLTLKEGNFISDCLFKDCKIDELILENVTGHNTVISGGEYKKIVIRNDQTTWNELESLTITNVKSKLELQINDLTVKNALDINGCSDIQSLRLGKIKAGKFSLNNNTAFGECQLRSLSVKGRVVLSGTYRQMIFHQFDLQQEVHLISIKIAERIVFNNGKTMKLFISNNSVVNRIKLRNWQGAAINFSNGEVNRFNIFRSEVYNSLRLIRESKNSKAVINYFYLIDPILNGPGCSFEVLGIDFKTFAVRKFYNNVVFILQDTEVSESFSINYSDLNPTDKSTASFKNVVLQDCDKISFYNTNILGTEFFNVRWNSDYTLDKMKEQLKYKNTEFKLKHYWTIKESYRQLKIASIQNSNKIDANFFQSGELDIYYHILELRTFQSPRKFIKHSGDLLILSFSKFLGGYGLKIWRPIIFWALLHLFMFNILLSGVNFGIAPFTIDLTNPDPKVTEKAVKLFFLLLSPIHGTEFYGVDFDESITDYVMRIVAGFFLYYILRASRKFIFSA